MNENRTGLKSKLTDIRNKDLNLSNFSEWFDEVRAHAEALDIEARTNRENGKAKSKKASLLKSDENAQRLVRDNIWHDISEIQEEATNEMIEANAYQNHIIEFLATATNKMAELLERQKEDARDLEKMKIEKDMYTSTMNNMFSQMEKTRTMYSGELQDRMAKVESEIRSAVSLINQAVGAVNQSLGADIKRIDDGSEKLERENSGLRAKIKELEKDVARAESDMEKLGDKSELFKYDKTSGTFKKIFEDSQNNTEDEQE